MISIIITSIIATIFYIVGAFLMAGKGGCLIAGYHFKPKGATAIKYHKYVMFRYGLIFTIGIAFVHAIIICAFLKLLTAMYILIGICTLFLVISMIYLLCSKNMKKARQLEKEETEKKNLQSN